jgi:hypothetical protein
MTDTERARAWGRIGGLRAWALNGPDVMVGPAHRGFRTRFERIVDPEGVLPPDERKRRADRARRAHMLSLAAKSAEVRRTKKADRESQIPRPAAVAPRGVDEPPSAA